MLKSADTILIIGSNTTENHPVIGSFIKERKRKGNCTLIVCDPRKIEMAKYADVYIRQKSGSDVVLLNGLMHVILRENLYASDFIEKNVNNFEKLKETMSKYTPQYVSEITGVSPELIEDAARAYAKGPNSAIFYTMGITQHLNGTDNVRTVANLALLCGMLGRPGTGVNPLRGQNNVQEPAIPDAFRSDPGYQKVTLPATQQKVKELWGSDLPATPGLSVVDDACRRRRKIKACTSWANSMVTEPDSDHVRCPENSIFWRAGHLPLRRQSSHTLFFRPRAGEGTFTNTCRAVQRVRKLPTSWRGPP